MFETTVGTHRPGCDDRDLTQQFPPIFHALLSGALNGGHRGDTEEIFRRDPLAAPLLPQSCASPPGTAQTSTLDEALTSSPTRARLRAVPGSGGAHRAEAHAVQPGHYRPERRTTGSGAHRAPEAEPQLSEQLTAGPAASTARPAASRGGRHRPLRAVTH